VKTDAKDAEHLSTLLHLDAFTAVTIPDEHTEAARDLVRAREDCRADLMRARHRLSRLFCVRGSSTAVGTPGPAPTRCGCGGNGSTRR